MADIDDIRPVIVALLRSCVDVHPSLDEAEVAADALVAALGRAGVESALRRLAAEPVESCDGCAYLRALLDVQHSRRCALGHETRRCCEYDAGEEVPR